VVLYIGRRLVLMVVAALGVTLNSLLVAHAVPADPIVSNLGQIASQRPEIVKAFRENWGLDQSLHVQYFTFLRKLYRGEFGTSINTRRAVAKDLAYILPATVELATATVFCAVLVGLPLGVLAALRRDGLIDHLARLGVTFIVGILYALVNLVVDLTYGWLGPRIHYSWLA